MVKKAEPTGVEPTGVEPTGIELLEEGLSARVVERARLPSCWRWLLEGG